MYASQFSSFPFQMITNHNTPKKSVSTNSTSTPENQEPLSLPQLKNSIMFKKFQHRQQMKQKSASAIDTSENKVQFQRYNILSEMKHPQLKNPSAYTYSGMGYNTKIKYHYLSSSDQTSNMILEKFGQGFLSSRVQNECVKHFKSNSNYMITEYKEEVNKRDDKSPILKEQISQMPASYYRQGIIFGASKQQSPRILLKKTSQSSRNKKFRQNVAINKMNSLVNNAIEIIHNEKREQQKKEEIADLKSKRVRKMFEVYKQYF